MDAGLYGVFGNSVEHSLSPRVHYLFAKQHGIELNYSKYVVKDSLENALSEFVDKGGVGASITSPFKVEAYNLCSELSDAAKEAKSVNTLTRLPNGKWKGDNTDGIGLINDLKRLDILNNATKVLVIGAGGVARGIIPALQKQGMKVFIFNRTFEKGKILADEFGVENLDEHHLRVYCIKNHFDIVINATSNTNLSITRYPFLIRKRVKLYYDINYKCPFAFNRPTLSLIFSKPSYIEGTTGAGMLVYQAAEQYNIWHGYKPDVNEILKLFRIYW